MNLSHAYGTPPDERDGVALLNRALDIGVTLLDTAALYGAGRNERLIAKLKRRRSEFILSSKCVLDFRDGKRVLDGSPKSIAATLDQALLRLETDFIDLYYLHRLDQDVPIEESVGALVRAREAGKIGTIGLSEMSAPTIRRAHAVHPIAAVQSEYSPAVRNPEVAVLETCRELGIGFVAFSPLARGLLAGSIRDDQYEAGDLRLTLPRFVQPNLTPNLLTAARFASIASEAGVTPAQLSLGWVLSRGQHIVPIPGTRQLTHLEQNTRAATLGIAAEVFALVDELLPPNALLGARYPANAQAQIDTELIDQEPLEVFDAA